MATLYAQPTKEWVIPAKPKPGRKPKRDDPVVDDDASSDSKAKKVQNRAAQRAFRERKQSQLADLQARLAQYEQGEIERNVALQNIAKKLKEDNERLKSDNEMLREEGDRVREENLSMRNRLRELQEEFSAYRRKMEPDSTHFDLQSTVTTRKRSRTDSNATSTAATTLSTSSSSSTVGGTTKRKRGKEDARSSTPGTSTKHTYTNGTRRMSTRGYSTLPPDYAPPPQLVHIYSPATSEGSSRPSLIMSPVTSENSVGAVFASLNDTPEDDDDIMSNYTNDKLSTPVFSSVEDNNNELHMVDCGFCSRDSDSCVCREVSVGINQLLESTSPSEQAETSALNHGINTTTGASSPTRRSSILDNLPPVQPGVPLRLRRSKRIDDSGPVHLTPVPQLSKPITRPVCSGDPSNCEACADDPFGRAFCTALANGGVCKDSECKRCPKSNRTVSGEDQGKGKGKAIPIDMDVGVGVGPSSTLSMGIGMGMNMETGMLLCCGDPKLCGGGGVCGLRAPSSSSSPIKSPRRPLLQATSSSSSIQLPREDTRSESEGALVRLPPIVEDSDGEMPTNDAWERLKSHPNIRFADLALLADVVAGRTKCAGPRVSLSPVPEDASECQKGEDNEDSIRPHPTLVPQEALVRCGRERMMRVQAEGVRDALAMLDVQRP